MANRQGQQPESENGAELTDEQLQLDSIGCTANVILADFKD